jgi:hypothetical protein
VIEFDETSINLDFSGKIGFDPFVLKFKMSDCSPDPINKPIK